MRGWVAFGAVLFLGCASEKSAVREEGPEVAPEKMEETSEETPAAKAANPGLTDATFDIARQADEAKKQLLAKYGEAHRARIEKGVAQVAALWRPDDGGLVEFAVAHFAAEGKDLDALFKRLETIFEQTDGHYLELVRELSRPAHVDMGPMLPVDPLLASFDPTARLNEDLFAAKIAFVVLLNFPLTTLEQKLKEGPSWTRRQWAETRLAGRFSRRVPGEVQAQQARAAAAADLYISQYNIWMHHVLTEKGERLWPKDLRLISHWNLRDELKGNYGQPNALEKQRMIIQIMNRIVTQTIPQVVIDNPRVDWEPFSNKVTAAPAEEIETGAPERAVSPDASPEPNTRFAKLLENFRTARLADPYTPIAPSAIARSFELQREIPEARVRAMLTAVLASPLVPKVAAEIEKRLGRKLEAQDLWFNGFKSRGGLSETQLDELVRKRYPNKEAFEKDIPRILTGLEFAKDKATFLANHIRVDPSRGAGHAMPAARRGDFPRLRTRVGSRGMDYKGYNIAIHELGHNVEQVFSLYNVDSTLLQGVPNTAFTEALAFVFQARDLELLGQARPDKAAERDRVLNTFWQTWEIAGVGLVDVDVWHWMYANPNATPAELKDAVNAIAKKIWNQYYAPVLGTKDSPLLAIYSHMISNQLYLVDYPIGHLIAFQLEEHMRTAKSLGAEFERMTSYGAVVPDMWMINAVGKPVGPEALLAATERALATAK